MSLDLSKLGLRSVRKSEQAKAVITGVLLASNSPEVMGHVQTLLKAEGLDFPFTKAYDDGSGVVALDEDFDQGGKVIRVSEDMALVVKGFEPFGQKLEALTFGQAADARGFYSGLEGAMGVLRDMVYERMYKADSPAAAAQDLQSVMSEFVQYVSGLAQALPEAVFKIERKVGDALVEVAKAEELKKAETPVVEQKAAFTACAVCKNSEACAAAGKCAAEVEKTETPVEDLVAKGLQAVTETLAAIQASVQGLTSVVEKIEGQQKSTEEKLAEAVKKSEDAARAVQGTVIGAAVPGDPEARQQQVVKSDDDPRIGVFDTAYLQKRGTRR